jgi:putative tryptophan/tyrosine transport system substrate-binding protein
MKKRITLWLLATLFLANVSLAEAQQTGKIFRIGFLDNSTAAGSVSLLEVFRQELRKLGWIEGKNITIEYRFAEQRNERLAGLAADLVRLKVDLIVTSGGPTPFAAKEATTTIPIVMTTSTNPVEEGLVASLARPGGNVTGFAGLASELKESESSSLLLNTACRLFTHRRSLSMRAVSCPTGRTSMTNIGARLFTWIRS